MDINVGTRCEGSYGSETLRERMAMGRRNMGTNGDGIELSGNEWGWIKKTDGNGWVWTKFPLPRSFLEQTC
jgi:hypothetical protein